MINKFVSFVKLTGGVNHFFGYSYFAICSVLFVECTSDFQVFVESVLFIASSALSVKMLPVVDLTDCILFSLLRLLARRSHRITAQTAE